MNAGADTELLNVVFLLEKDLKEHGKEDQVLTVHTFKSSSGEISNADIELTFPRFNKKQKRHLNPQLEK